MSKSYEHMSVHVTCDGAVLSPKGTGTGSLTGGNEEVRLYSVNMVYVDGVVNY